MRFRGADGKYDSSRDLRISTDESWEWSALVPNAKGKYGKPVKDWATAELVKNIPWIAKTSPKVQEILALAMSDSGKSIPVRVSLVKSDLLMRAMGRPNREQVVTVRPEELSTLQALNLANGDALAGILSRGAAKLLKSRDGVETPGKLIDWMFQYTLSREPGADERAILTEMLQPKMEQKQVEDLLWTVFMLPEFQLIQ